MPVNRDNEEGERQYGPVDPEIGDAGHAGWRGRRDDLDRAKSHRQSQRPAAEPQEQALGEGDPDEPGPTGAQRGPERHLPGQSVGAGEEQVGDVGAGDEQQQSHRREECEQGGAGTATHCFRNRNREGAELLGRRILTLSSPTGGEGP